MKGGSRFKVKKLWGFLGKEGFGLGAVSKSGGRPSRGSSGNHLEDARLEELKLPGVLQPESRREAAISGSQQFQKPHSGQAVS